MVTQIIDNISFTLKEFRDFSFLSQYGKVFCVFDQHDSGNISFGVNSGKTKLFIKVAGAKTAEFSGDTEKAAETLKNAMTLYETLKHPSLIQLVEHYELEDLYIAVFQWAEGECLYDHWNFHKYKENPQLQSPSDKFKQLPIEKRLKAIRTVFEFLIHTEKMGYVAVDFYDGSILYEFNKDTTMICDIDFFRKKPAYNYMGEDFWGTKRLKSPEEYTYGAVIDEATNVFTLGALLFHFLGGHSEADIRQMYKDSRFFPCELEKWGLSRELYDVLFIAVEEDRNKRYKTIAEFFNEWNRALSI